MSRFLLLLLAMLLFVPASGMDFSEIYRIQISNTVNGSIEVSRNSGVSWEAAGHVLLPTVKVNPKGFTASQWISSGEVAASAVNAIHIKVDNAQTIFSILPKDFLDNIRNYNSYLSPDSSIYTDIEAGRGIFGGGYAPFVGNKVYLFDKLLDKPPQLGDVITIIVARPAKWPKEIVFENRFGGKITAAYFNGSEEVIGEVLRPVLGIGRFAGSRFVPAGRIRANHSGVIDISTSVGNRVGGFQIIPSNHAQSPEMGGARTATQWMVVGPPQVTGASLEGSSPLFKYFIKPQYDEDDINAFDWENKFLARFLVEVKIKDKDTWRPMPIYALNADEDLPVEANRALEKVTHIRILFPQSSN